MNSTILHSHHSLMSKFLPVLLGVMVLAIASQLSIPMTPVPLTFQSATVILIGMALGPRYGAGVILSYLAAGIGGLPVFADLSAGAPVLVGPTGGYLIGFVPAAFVSGYLAQMGFAKNALLSFVAACIGTAIIFSCGLLQLTIFLPWQEAVAVGLMPFIASETVKLIAVAFIIPKLWKL